MDKTIIIVQSFRLIFVCCNMCQNFQTADNQAATLRLRNRGMLKWGKGVCVVKAIRPLIGTHFPVDSVRTKIKQCKLSGIAEVRNRASADGDASLAAAQAEICH